MRLTASIVTHRPGQEQMEKVLACLMVSPVERVFIIDNSPDDSLRMSLPADSRIEYRHVENRGFGAGHNEAIREIIGRSDYHLVLNADVCWQGDVLGRMVGYMDSHPSVGLMGPKVYYPDRMLQYTCRRLPTPSDLIAKRFIPARLTRRHMERYLLAGHDHDFPLHCSYLLGSFLLFRTAALRECGLFDERFFMYPEDIDISRRIRNRWDVLYWPQVSITHEHAAASRKNLKMLWIHITNMIMYFNKWGWFSPNRDAKPIEGFTPLPKGKTQPGRG